MRISDRLTLILLLLIVLCFSDGALAETFNYKMADQPEDSGDDLFYVAPDPNITLVNPSRGKVRNVIVCIGDGMGFNHVMLARHKADVRRLHMERLPVHGQVTTYSANKAVTDSAASATAMACGVKTNNGMISMTPDKTPYSTVLELLQDKGWRTGLVATSQISHATPACFASHVDARSKQKEIAVQLVDNRVDVLLGGGRKFWSDELLAQAADLGYQMIETRDQLAQIELAPVIGLFNEYGLTTFAPEPMLAEMSQAAITVLSARSKDWFASKPKFFLMIEGSQIDWASHANDTERTIRQTLLFDMAVREVIEFAQQDRQTLVIVTSDHETGGLLLKSDEQNQIETKWTTDGHTPVDVPIYAFGPGSDMFAGILDNTDIAKRIANLTGIKQFPIVRKPLQQDEQISKKRPVRKKKYFRGPVYYEPGVR